MHGVKLPVLLKIFDKQEFVSMFEHLINELISSSKKIGVNFQVFLEHASLDFLTT